MIGSKSRFVLSKNKQEYFHTGKRYCTSETEWQRKLSNEYYVVDICVYMF